MVAGLHFDELVERVVVVDEGVVAVLAAQRLLSKQFASPNVKPVHATRTREAKEHLAIGGPLRHLPNKLLAVVILAESFALLPN